MSGLVFGKSIVNGDDIPILCNNDGSLAVTLSVIGGIGSATPVATWATLPVAAVGNAGQIYAITDFGYPYVLVQSTGSAWKQITHFNCTWELLPSATTFLGFVGYVNNFFGGFRVIARAAAGSNYWRPFNPVRLINYVTSDPPTTLGPNDPVQEYVLTGNIALPNPGFILLGDLIELDGFVVRAGTLTGSSPTTSLRMGTNATPVNNPIAVAALLQSTSSTVSRSNHKAVITAVTKTVSASSFTPGVVATTAITTRTITDITTASQFASLTIIATGVAETNTVYSVEATLFPNA